MIPITQTKFVIKNSKGDMIVRGNCVAACIASLMELQITDVPNVEVLFHISDTYYYEVLNMWLHSFNKEINTDNRFSCFHKEHNQYQGNQIYTQELKDKFYLVSGKSSRGFNHLCIYKNGILVHDPYPTREGLITEDYFELIDDI